MPSLPVLTKSELSAAGLYKVSEELVHGARGLLALGLPGLILLMCWRRREGRRRCRS